MSMGSSSRLMGGFTWREKPAENGKQPALARLNTGQGKATGGFYPKIGDSILFPASIQAVQWANLITME